MHHMPNGKDGNAHMTQMLSICWWNCVAFYYSYTWVDLVCICFVKVMLICHLVSNCIVHRATASGHRSMYTINTIFSVPP